MGKKRSRGGEAKEAKGTKEHPADKMDVDAGSGDDDDDMDIVDVDFELFNYDADVDFLGVKTLLRQLFGADAALLDLSALGDLVVRQNTIGSTCKVDGRETDPYAFLTVLNVGEHRDAAPAVARLAKYLAAKARSSSSPSASAPAPAQAIADALEKAVARKKGGGGDTDDGPVVGLVLADRLINMPAEVVPPMWAMMLDEVEDAVEDGEPYEFTHYLVVSRAYREVASALDEEEDRPRKQRRKKTKKEGEGDDGDAVADDDDDDKEDDGDTAAGGALQYFHPEDEEMRTYATAVATYRFTKEDELAADSKRAFQEMGIRPVGLMMLIEAGSKLKDAIKAIGEYVGGPGS